MTLEDRIFTSDARLLLQVLALIAAGQPQRELPTAIDQDLAHQLATQLDVPIQKNIVPTSEVVRAALLALASDPDYRTMLQHMLDEPRPERFPALETVLVATTVLTALQTHIKVTRDKNGKWAVALEKRAIDVQRLKDLVAKLLSLGEP